MKKCFISVIFLLILVQVSGQVLRTGVEIKSSELSYSGEENFDPHNVSLDTRTVIYKAEQSVTLQPGFFASSLTNSNTSNNYFLAKIDLPISYAELKKDLDGSFYTDQNELLNFKYIEKYMDGNLNYQIYNYKREPLISIQNRPVELVLEKKVGTNFYSIHLNKDNIPNLVSTSEMDSYYILEVINEKSEKFYLRFKYKPLF